MSIEHAAHNEELCDHLLTVGKFNDWVVTSAFYSALHFAHGSLFPIIRDGVSYASFNEYFLKYIEKKKKLKISKHHATKIIVSEERRSASPHYRWLFDACMNSRYNSYSVSPEKAITAKAKLLLVKSEIISPSAARPRRKARKKKK